MGHRRRREEGKPVLLGKFQRNLNTRFSDAKTNIILGAMNDAERLLAMSVPDFMAMWAVD